MDYEAYERYANVLNNASLLAQKELDDALGLIDLDRPRMARNALVPIMTDIITRYAGLAALAAAEYYEQERADALGGSYSAIIAEPVPPEKIEASVRYATGYLFGDDDEKKQTGVRGLFDWYDR